MQLKKYASLLQELNSQILVNDFDVIKNKNKLEKITEIYEEIKSKNYDKAKLIISELWIDVIDKFDYFWKEQKSKINSKISKPWSPISLQNFLSKFKKKESSWSKLQELSSCNAIEWWILEIPDAVNNDWNIENNYDEDNIEIFNSIEMISEIFLQNLENKLWTQK